MSHVKMLNPGMEFFMPKIDEHAAIVEREIEKILNDNGVALDEPGIELMQIIPESNPLQFIYQVKRNGISIGTFGLEMDMEQGVIPVSIRR
jgi:hypothetical protein